MVCQLIIDPDRTPRPNKDTQKERVTLRSRSESPASSCRREKSSKHKKLSTTTDEISEFLVLPSKYQSSSCTNLSNLSNVSFELNFTLKTPTESPTNITNDHELDDDFDLLSFKNSTKSLSGADEEEKEDADDTQSILKQNVNISLTKASSKTSSLKRQLSSNCSVAELVSLSSLTSNYSQFDFTNNYTTDSELGSKPIVITKNDESSKGSLSGFAAFLTRFTSNNKSKITPKPSQAPTTMPPTSFMSKLFSKTHSNASVCVASSSASSVCELNVPNSVLIFENRPSNLPAKLEEEELKHRQEYERMVAHAKKKELKETQLKMKKCEQQLKKEDFMTNSLKVWINEIIPSWEKMKNAKRTQQLWWHGLPPSIRGKVWMLAIGNDLCIKNDTYLNCVTKAEENIEILSRRSTSNETNEIDTSLAYNSGVELIRLDVARTFPQLCFFQRNGPYHDVLHNVLGAYASFNPRVGYVQGMSFLAAILLLNMEANEAFTCLANLLNNDYLMACFRMDQIKINRYFKLHQILFQFNMPKLYDHFESQKVKADLYLIDWVFTLFSRSLPLDVVSRVWDIYLRDKEEFLYRASLGILNLYKDELLQMDFINIVTFLNKLPEDINSTKLFKSIEQMKTSIDNENSFAYFISTILNS